MNNLIICKKKNAETMIQNIELRKHSHNFSTIPESMKL